MGCDGTRTVRALVGGKEVTVAELINELQKFPEDMDVYTLDYIGYGETSYEKVDEVDLWKKSYNETVLVIE